MSRTKLVIALIVAAATSASAQPKKDPPPPTNAGGKAKHTRQTEVKVDVKMSDRSKPIQKKDPDPKEQRPTLTAEDVLSIEGLVGEIRDKQELLLEKLITETPDHRVEEKSNYYFMLGELYAKQQRFWRLRAVQLQIDADAQKDPKQKTRMVADAKAGADKAKDYLLKAVKTYKGLTDNEAFRNYPKMDMALFYYGYTLQGGKYMKEARLVYDKLLKNYPASKYVPEAHLAFADYHFEQGQLADAENRYRQVLKFPNSSAYWYAMYKMGWIHLNLQRFTEALDVFFQVANATKSDPKQQVLNRAAKKDFVRAYAEIGKADKAYVAFQRVDNKYAFDMLEILADLYLVQGKSANAIYVYGELMKTDPKHKNVCLWQYNISHAMLTLPGSTHGDKVREIENLVRLWGALKTKKVLPASEAQECHDNAAAMSGEHARAYHSESAKTKNTDTLAFAEKLYKVYLDVFPDAQDYAQTQYYYAELIWARADGEKNPRLQTELWENAAVAFTDVVKGGKVEPKLMKEAAYAAVLGWKNALNVDPRVKNNADKVEDASKDYKTVPEKKEIPAREQKMLAAFDIYINYIKDPKDEELVGMKFLKANIYRRYNHFDQAIPLFLDILDKHKTHETAEFSAQLLLDTYNRMQKYDELVALVEKLDADKKFLEGKEELATVLAKIKAQSMRKKAEKLEKIGKETKDFAQLVACGQAYLDIYNRNPEASDNDEVLYNALVCFHEGKSIGAAILVFERYLVKYYPNSKLMPRAVGRIGKAYGDIAFYDRAADKLEQYATKYAGEKDAYQAMSDAVFYRKGIGDDAKAIDDTRFFIRTFGGKNPQEAANAMWSMTTIHEKRNDGNAVVAHLRDYIRQFGDKGGADRLVIAHAKIGKILWDQSCPLGAKMENGSCVTITRDRAISSKTIKKKGNELPTQCGAESKIKLSVVPRDARKAGEAAAAFKAATSEFEKRNGKTGGDEGGAKYYYAQVKFAEADKDFESYLALKFPPNLDFDPTPERKAIREKSLKRFGDWLEARNKIGIEASKKYQTVLDIKDAANSIAASARLAQISQNLSDALFSAEIPKDVRSGEFAEDKVDAFCDKMTEIAEPLDLRAIDGYSKCLARSTDLGWFSEWSKLCEHELGQIKPEEFPTAAELRGDPDQLAPVRDVEAPATKLE
ncbi:MAG: tetratricopeptide repeat protein [Deltaproteobacteria bacterium]|nr:tetratricopeptide repeat protein [Deltaproteobacteria bacterium]MCW5802693.1 tetratricopeptide repeat protein [Deltaproteobacteria bacterium]